MINWFRQPIPATEDLPVEFKGIQKLIQLLEIWHEINSGLPDDVESVAKEFAASSTTDELRSAISDVDRLLTEDPFRIGEVSHSLGQRFYTIEEGKVCLTEWREALALQKSGAGDAVFVPVDREKIGMPTELVVWRVAQVSVSAHFWTSALGYRIPLEDPDDELILVPENAPGPRLKLFSAGFEELYQSHEVEFYAVYPHLMIDRLTALGAKALEQQGVVEEEVVTMVAPDGIEFSVKHGS